LGGLIGRRVSVTSGFSAYRGSSLGESNSKVYDSMNVSVGVQVALNRVMAVGTDYSYYHYRFTNDVTELPPGFLRQTDRQSIRVSLSVWAPLITQARRTNASR
jgi:opacity protein-like surface antigen